MIKFRVQKILRKILAEMFHCLEKTLVFHRIPYLSNFDFSQMLELLKPKYCTNY